MEKDEEIIYYGNRTPQNNNIVKQTTYWVNVLS